MGRACRSVSSLSPGVSCTSWSGQRSRTRPLQREIPPSIHASNTTVFQCTQRLCIFFSNQFTYLLVCCFSSMLRFFVYVACESSSSLFFLAPSRAIQGKENPPVGGESAGSGRQSTPRLEGCQGTISPRIALLSDKFDEDGDKPNSWIPAS